MPFWVPSVDAAGLLGIGAGRACAFVCHWANCSTRPLLRIHRFMYRASPFNVPPTMVVLPVAVALTVRVTASAFKKYL